ncbi:hypothetical protein LXT21_44130 [Myxococcus sp. K38C18041901]|uniref:hypothetical protein n=1 Tax=Myxococcus guangdongensis TaxID=2906760 RepID=UPI0020A7007C|nr:hypothetical protein [Myxococcus guangdongensis]MCP3065778.1 hypothetical protein [Myxococcus guangdongensis]
MSRSARKTFLSVEHSATRSLLERLGPGQFIERIGLESRLDAISEELEQLANVPEPVRSAVYFDGSPVIAQEAIDASFAVEAVSCLQEIVEKVGVSSVRGAQSRDFRLRISGVTRGSFGFEFTQADEDALGLRRMKTAMDETSTVLQQLTAEEDAFEEFMAEADPRVLKSLHKFVKVLANSDATIRYVGGESEVSVRKDHVYRAFGWMEETEPAVDEDDIPGTLNGFLASSKQFEVLASTGVLYRGRFGALVTDDDLARFAFKPCIARIKTTTVTRPGRPLKKSHLLVSLSPPRVPVGQ